MIEIRLYNNSAENNRVDKMNYLFLDYRYQGLLREPSSVMTPQVDIEVTDESLQNMLRCNYAYIDVFNRYYYITDMVNIANSIWRIYLRVDVLMSFKNDINLLEAYVARNEYDYDTSLPDNRVPVLNGNNVGIVRPYLLPDNFQKYFWKYNTLPHDISARCVVLQICNSQSFTTGPVGADAISNFAATYVMSFDKFRGFCEYVCQANVFNDIKWLFQNPTENLINAMILPFDIISNYSELYVTSASDMYIGHTLIDYHAFGDEHEIIYRINANYPCRIFAGGIKFTPFNEYKFLSYEPYSNMQIYLPYYGFTDFDVNLFNTDGELSIYVYYVVDVTTGKATVMLTNELYTVGRTNPLKIIDVDIGMPVPLGYSNKSDISRNLLFTGIKAAVDVLSLGATAAVGAGNLGDLQLHAKPNTTRRTKLGAQIARTERENVAEMFTGSLNASGNFLIDTITAMQGKVSGGRSEDSYLKGLYYLDGGASIEELYHPVPVLLYKLPKPVYTSQADIKQYAHMVGRPLNRIRQLSTVYGYTEIAGIHLEWAGYERSMSQEREEIYDLLKTGVMFPEPPET